MMKRVYTLFIYILLAVVAGAQNFVASGASFMGAVAPKHEVRAVWLTTIGGLDWPHTYANGSRSAIDRQKKELTGILDRLRAAGVNTVLLQTRIRATTIYPSAYEPWDGCLSGKPGTSPGYDALAFAIDECHRRGMELHAWVVAIPVGKWNGRGCASLRKIYPKLIKKIGDDGFMNPEDPLTGNYMADICDEIVRNYDIDGIHLDYIRYPEEWKIRVTKEKGRSYITNIVRKVSEKVKSRKPWVKMSCSPIGKADDLPRMTSRGWNAYSRVCQDAQGWLRDGLMDQLYPMMYFKDNNFYPFALDWKERSYGRTIVAGLGVYFMSPKERNWQLADITREMEVARQWGIGHCYFRSRYFTDNTKGIYDFAQKQFDTHPALVPPMTWQNQTPPTPPTTLTTDTLHSTLSWSGATDRSGGPYLTYNVYCSDKYPVDVNNPGNLMVQRLRETTILVPLQGRYYAVTAMDRYGNESQAVQNHRRHARRVINEPNQHVDGLPIFPCDGRTVTLGRLPINYTDLLSVETLQGQSLTVGFAGERIDVRTLPEGLYQVRALGKKKANHRLGYFMIERHNWR